MLSAMSLYEEDMIYIPLEFAEHVFSNKTLLLALFPRSMPRSLNMQMFFEILQFAELYSEIPLFVFCEQLLFKI
jgi:hypothetical protein